MKNKKVDEIINRANKNYFKNVNALGIYYYMYESMYLLVLSLQKL